MVTICTTSLNGDRNCALILSLSPSRKTFVMQMQRVYFEVGKECNVNALPDACNMPRVSLLYAHRTRGERGGALNGGTELTNPFSTNKCTVLLAPTCFGTTADTHTHTHTHTHIYILLELTTMKQSYNAYAYQLIRRKIHNSRTVLLLVLSGFVKYLQCT